MPESTFKVYFRSKRGLYYYNATKGMVTKEAHASEFNRTIFNQISCYNPDCFIIESVGEKPIHYYETRGEFEVTVKP